MGDVAFAAGFSSIRTFNDTVREVFALLPQRAAGGPEGQPPSDAVPGPGTISLRLPFRAPLYPDNLFGAPRRDRACPASRSGATAPTAAPCACPTGTGSSP